MMIADILSRKDRTRVSFEILPPLKGDSIESIYRTVEPLMDFNPPYINVTYHREEMVYKQLPSGLLERKIVRKRPGTVAISAALRFRFGIEVVPHIICGGFTREETENALIELNFLGIHNLLVVRGDADKGTNLFVPEKGGHAHSVDLIRQIMDMNRGKYLDEELENYNQTQFSVGVAGYPEKHAEAPNLNSDLQFLKEKVDAGAEYIVTQMFFDNAHYFHFVDQCRLFGIQVPVIPGLKPVSVKNHLNILPRTFHVDIPEALEKEVQKCKTNDEVREVGVEWTSQQAKELIRSGVPLLHLYTMGKPDNIQQICRNVF